MRKVRILLGHGKGRGRRGRGQEGQRGLGVVVLVQQEGEEEEEEEGEGEDEGRRQLQRRSGGRRSWGQGEGGGCCDRAILRQGEEREITTEILGCRLADGAGERENSERGFGVV